MRLKEVETKIIEQERKKIRNSKTSIVNKKICLENFFVRSAIGFEILYYKMFGNNRL